LGDYEEKTNHTSGITEKIHYLSGAIYIERSNGTSSFYYAYTDYLGSLIALTNESGTVVERYAYDPWGKRRNPANWAENDSRTAWIVNRGYTMHEHLDAFGIINMNGRVYDPMTAMFFSPDPFVFNPANWLSYNRYSYVLNNPFKYVDPGGNNPLLIMAGALFLLFTDIGYDLQKYFSHTAIHINGGSGNERQFVGVEISVGVPQILPLSYRHHTGAAYYWKDYDNMYSGWETSHGGEWSGLGFIMFSSTNYNRKGEKYDQSRDVWKIGVPFLSPLFNLQVENDADMNVLNLPWLPKHEASDKYMSSEIRLRLGLIEMGNTTVTGNPDNYSIEYGEGKGPFGTYSDNEFSAGILYLQIGFIRIGYNSETIRDKTQNWAHDNWFSTPRFPVDKKKHPDRWYWEFVF